MLEHSVVAVQLSSVDVSPALASPHAGVGKKAGSGVRSDASHEPDPPTTQVVSLANLPNGFQVSCFGYIESTEQELLAGQIAIRLPIKRDVMELVMTKGISTGIYGASGAQAKGDAGKEGRVEASGTSSASPHVRISIAFSEAVQRETCFMEGYP
ncbi:unnamed protein product [Phytomonas sp. EM1]|nr:unnamed protein product [Phytomonas sp. EM1]|eukprot:CCW65508.1 unnamed protein product [Phytomonas sp. isolate EM1]